MNSETGAYTKQGWRWRQDEESLAFLVNLVLMVCSAVSAPSLQAMHFLKKKNFDSACCDVKVF